MRLRVSRRNPTSEIDYKKSLTRKSTSSLSIARSEGGLPEVSPPLSMLDQADGDSSGPLHPRTHPPIAPTPSSCFSNEIIPHPPTSHQLRLFYAP